MKYIIKSLKSSYSEYLSKIYFTPTLILLSSIINQFSNIDIRDKINLIIDSKFIVSLHVNNFSSNSHYFKKKKKNSHVMSRQVSFSLRQNGVSIEIVRARYPRESMLERGLIHEIRLFKAKRLEPLWEVPAREILFALRQLERTISCHSLLLSFIFFSSILSSRCPSPSLSLSRRRYRKRGRTALPPPLKNHHGVLLFSFFLSNNDGRYFSIRQ